MGMHTDQSILGVKVQCPKLNLMGVIFDLDYICIK
jgi:hypothetical protein